jgi:hypothetical protein
MSENQIASRNLTLVGEEISHELGAKMVKDFQDANPEEVPANYIGRNIIESILAQPGCAGIRFYNAINEVGRKTLVYVGVDNDGNIITQFTGINTLGQLTKEKGIVADRSESSWHWDEA